MPEPVSDEEEHVAWQLLALWETFLYDDEYVPALMEALKLCIDHKKPLPDWVAQRVWATMLADYNRPQNRKRFEKMTRRRKRHSDRWSAVMHVHYTEGVKWDDAWEAAAQYLGGGVKADTVRRATTSFEQIVHLDPCLLQGERLLARSQFSKVGKKPAEKTLISSPSLRSG